MSTDSEIFEFNDIILVDWASDTDLDVIKSSSLGLTDNECVKLTAESLADSFVDISSPSLTSTVQEIAIDSSSNINGFVKTPGVTDILSVIVRNSPVVKRIEKLSGLSLDTCWLSLNDAKLAILQTVIVFHVVLLMIACIMMPIVYYGSSGYLMNSLGTAVSVEEAAVGGSHAFSYFASKNASVPSQQPPSTSNTHSLLFSSSKSTMHSTYEAVSRFYNTKEEKHSSASKEHTEFQWIDEEIIQTIECLARDIGLMLNNRHPDITAYFKSAFPDQCLIQDLYEPMAELMQSDKLKSDDYSLPNEDDKFTMFWVSVTPNMALSLMPSQLQTKAASILVCGGFRTTIKVTNTAKAKMHSGAKKLKKKLNVFSNHVNTFLSEVYEEMRR